MSSSISPFLVKLRPRGICSNEPTWDDMYLGDLAQIIASSDNGGGLRSLQFVYIGQDGKPCVTPERGGLGNNVHVVDLSPWDGERVVMVSGHYDSSCLRSIKFTTNMTTYGPFGAGGKMTPFVFNCKSGIISFHGSSSNDSICNIGVNIKAPQLVKEGNDYYAPVDVKYESASSSLTWK